MFGYSRPSPPYGVIPMKNFIHRFIFLLITLSIGNNLYAETCAEIYKKAGVRFFRKILEAATTLSNPIESKKADKVKNKADKVIDDFYNNYLKKANTSFIREEIIEPLHKFNIEGNELGLCNKKYSYYIYDPRGPGRWKHLTNYQYSYDNYILLADLLSLNDKNIFLIDEFMEIAKTAQKIRKDKEEKYKDQSAKENKDKEMIIITREEYKSLLESSKQQILESTLCEEHSRASGS